MTPKKNLCALVLTICLFVLHPASAFAGGIGGGGGHESALLFRSLGQLIHNELVLNRVQMAIAGENEIDPEAFKIALETTEIIPILYREKPEASLNEELLSCYNEAQQKYTKGYTALYAFNCNSNNKGILFLIVEDFDKDTIKANPGASLALVSHEYFRAMKLDEDNYNISVNYYVDGFFNEILKKTEVKDILGLHVDLAQIEYKFGSQFGSDLIQTQQRENIDYNYIRTLIGEITRMDEKLPKYYTLILSSAIGRDTIEVENKSQSKLRLGTGIRVKKNEEDALIEQQTFAREDLLSTRARLKKYEQTLDEQLLPKEL